MTVQELLTVLSRVFFLLLGLLCFLDYLRQREAIKRDVFLAVASLASNMVINTVNELYPVPAFIQTLGDLALLAQPYLFIRLSHYLQALHPTIHRFAFISMLLVWLVRLFIINPESMLFFINLLAYLAYFVGFNTYVMFRFVRGYQTSTGVLRERLRLCAIGTGLLALALAMILPIVLGSAGREALIICTLLALMFSALSLLFGIVPPRWLQEIWQLEEIRDFLRNTNSETAKQWLSKDNPKQGTLFADEQGKVRGMMTAQANALVEQSALVEQLQGYSGGLEEKVKQGSLALEKSESRYHSIIDNMLEGFQIIDYQWRYDYINEAAAQHGRKPREELLGHSMLELYPGIDSTEMFALLKRVMEQRKPEHADFEFIYADGSKAWFELSAQPIPEGIFILSLEITKRKQDEEALRGMNEALELRVKERTAHLEALNKELEAFSYSVSHDLRAPLRALDGFSQALIEDYQEKLDDEGREYLALIRYESQRMGQLIDDLIGLARLSRHDLYREQVDFSAMVKEISEGLKKTDSSRDVTFLITDNVVGCADPRLAHIVLQNLLGNAWKYSSKVPQARIEFGIQQQDGKDCYFIRDNGVGFNMAYVHKLFGAFQRLHGMAEFEGTGIGLATVQRIIHRHGGVIRAEGVVNEGACFYFSFGDMHC